MEVGLGRRGVFKTLDAWRAVAAISVVCYHSAFPAVANLYPFLSNHWFFANIRVLAYGVQIFFVISGYCIAQAAINSFDRNAGTRNFLFHRWKRIYPPYFIVSVFAICISVSSGYMQNNSTATSMLLEKGFWYYGCSALMLQKVCGVSPILPLFWTLCYEAAFYVLVSISLAIAAATAKRSSLIFGLHGLTVACAAWAATFPDTAVYPFDLWPEFGLGILAYDILVLGRKKAAFALLGLVYLLMAVYAFRSIDPGEALYRAVPSEQAIVSMIFCTVLLATFSIDQAIARILPVRIFGAVGVFSYSLYLTHGITIGPASQVGKMLHLVGELYSLSMALQLALSILIAWIFYIFAEAPFMSKKQKLRADELVSAQSADVIASSTGPYRD
jgi:peptidoglycan/LPS O-acetylase OafA/YrhL